MSPPCGATAPPPATAPAPAYEAWTGRIFRSGHGPLAGRRAAQLEEGAGHRQGAAADPQLRFPRRESHDRVPSAPPQPASRRRLQPGPLSDTHFVPRDPRVPPGEAAVNQLLTTRYHDTIDGEPARTRERCRALTRVSSDSQPNTGKCAGSNRPASYRTSRKVLCTTCSASTASRRMPKARARRLKEWRADSSERARTSPSATRSNRATSETACSRDERVFTTMRVTWPLWNGLRG